MKFKFMDDPLLERERLSIHLQDISQPSRIGSQAIVRSILLTMRISTVLLISALHLSAAGLSQKITFSGTNVSLSAVFNAIEEQTGYGVIMSHANLASSKPVTVAFKDATLDEALTKCFSFQETKFRYSITGHTISIAKVESIVVAAPSTAEPPGGRPPEFVGVVSSEDGKPLVGATVEILKLNKKGLTNEKGEFSFSKIPDGRYKVEITFVGFERYQTYIEVGENPVKLMIGLKVSTNKLDDVLVIAYGTTTQRLSTGDVTTITAKEIGQQPINNPLLALEGRVPGLFISQATGLAGSGVTALIRGQNSIASGNDPFYVIDGVPYTSQLLPNFGDNLLGNSGVNNTQAGNPLSYINPYDIESISVLKDASATAIYGSRAANGAILITTKKGKTGPTKVDINLQNGWGKVSSKVNLLNTQQYLQMRHEARSNDGLTTQATDYDINGTWDTTRYTDWQKSLIGGTAQYKVLSATVSGGNASTQYLIGSTYYLETSVFPGDFSNKKGSLHFNINSVSSNQKFRIQLSGNYLVYNNQLSQVDLTGAAMSLAPDAPQIYNSDGSLNWAPNTSGASTWSNPLSYLYNKYENKTNNLVSDAILSYQLLPGLDVRSSFGYTNMQSNEIITVPLISTQPEFRPITQRTAGYLNNNINSWIIEPQATYNRTIGKGRLEVLVGTTFQQNNSNGQKLAGIGYYSDQVLEDIRSAATLIPLSSIAYIYKYSALFSRLNYIWQDKYIMNITARRDGSSRFGAANQFHNFGAAGIGWIFSQEKVIKQNLSFLSFGKLRASYGSTGNDQIGEYKFLNLYSPTSVGVAYQGVTGLQPNGLTNPYLQWEETKKLEFGLDVGILKDRVLLNANYYHNRSSNELLFYLLPIITGFGDITRNFPATVQNTGLEFTLNTINFKTKDFSWSTHINLTIPKNKLVAFPDLAGSGYAASLVIGQPLTIVHSFHFLNVDAATGIYQFGDSHGSTTTTPDTNYQKYATVLTNTSPAYYGGFQNTFCYKGFELDILFQFVKQKAFGYFFGSLPGESNFGQGNQPISVLRRWQKAGDIVPIQRYNSNYSLEESAGDAAFSDAAFSDASYIRLKNLSLSWQLPDSWSKKAHLLNASLYLHAQNFLTITNYKGLDPETKSLTSLPPLRVLTVGVQVRL